MRKAIREEQKTIPSAGMNGSSGIVHGSHNTPIIIEIKSSLAVPPSLGVSLVQFLEEELLRSAEESNFREISDREHLSIKVSGGAVGFCQWDDRGPGVSSEII